MLELSGVASAYGASQVLWDIDLKIAPGEAVTVLGRNGVGKTTLLKTIVGTRPLQGGRITFENRPLGPLPAYSRVRKGIAYVPQGWGIFPHLTVSENLTVGLASGNVRAVTDYVFELFPVLGEMMTRKGGNLSGGQQQHPNPKDWGRFNAQSSVAAGVPKAQTLSTRTLTHIHVLYVLRCPPRYHHAPTSFLRP